MKSGVSPQKLQKKQSLLANFKAISTSLGALGLDLHSSCPEPVNLFGAQSSLGAHKQSFGEARPRNAFSWCRACTDGH